MASGYKTSGFNSVSSGFGPRQRPTQGASTFHAGVDFRMPTGTGIETSIGLTYINGDFQPGGGGYYENFRDNQGNTYSLLHLNGPSGFTANQILSPGDVIAVSGNTGISTGPHLDFRMRDAAGNRINPTNINPATGLPYTAGFGPKGSNEGLGGTTRANLAQTQNARGDKVTETDSPTSPATRTDSTTTTDPNQLTDNQKTIQSDLNSLTTEFDRNNTTLTNLDTERAKLSEDDSDFAQARIQEIDQEKAELSSRNDEILGEVENKTAEFNKTDGAGSDEAGAGPPEATGAAKAAAGAGGAGGGAGCVGAGLLSGVAGMALGGVIGGMGMGINGALNSVTSAFNSLPGVGAISSAFSQASGLLSSGIMSNPIFGALSQVGSGILPGLSNVLPGVLNAAAGQLLSPLNAILQNPLNLPSVVQQMASSGGIGGFVKSIGQNMVGNFVGGTIANLTNNIQVAGAMSGISRTVVGGISEAMGQTFGTGPGGIGEIARNIDGVVTYGLSTLSNNLAAVAADMIATGNWNTSNLTRLMQPANIAGQIIARGLGEVTGLNTAIINAGIPLAAIDNPIYDAQVRNILNGINNQSALNSVITGFAVGVNLTNLGQLTDLEHMMKQSANTLPVANFQDLGKQLIELQVTQAKTFSEIGSAFLRIESSRELNHIVRLPTPMHKPTGELILKSFGYGSGTFGEVTPADMLGSAAGYVHNDTFKVMIDNHKWLKENADAPGGYPILQQYYILCDELTTLISEFTATPAPGGEEEGPPPPSSESLVYDWIERMETYLTELKEEAERLLREENDGALLNALELIEKAHATSTAQVLREASLWDRMGYSILEGQPMTLMGAYSTVVTLQAGATETGYGQFADTVERLATDDLYGDSIKAMMRQARNAQILDGLGVNTERFALPNSGYYRNPLGAYKDTYTDNLMKPPLNVQQIYFPPDPVQQYLMERDAVLSDEGIIDDALLPAQKDEAWTDLWWQQSEANDIVLRSIGEFAVNQAILKNMRLFGDNSIVMIDLDRQRRPIGTLTETGIINLDNENLIATLFDVVNRLLYGKIGVTKLDTPFHTDEIIYGIAELLGEVNAGTIDTLQNTYLGKTVLSELLTRFANRFKPINTAFDTRMDRNDPSTYGGTGPGIDPLFEQY